MEKEKCTFEFHGRTIRGELISIQDIPSKVSVWRARFNSIPVGKAVVIPKEHMNLARSVLTHFQGRGEFHKLKARQVNHVLYIINPVKRKWKNQDQLRRGSQVREYFSQDGHRFFRWQMADDVIISVVLMAHHRGASIRGMQVACKQVLGITPCASTLIRWRNQFGMNVCVICKGTTEVGSVLLCRGAIIPKKLDKCCIRFVSKLIPSGLLDELENFFSNSNEWKAYAGVGHPGRKAKFDQQEWKNIYCRRYYRSHPDYARSLLTNPENLYARIKLRELSPEERLERVRKKHREWSRKKNRKKHGGGKINMEMAMRGRRGAEARWNRKYTEPL
jgi:hypothetical protein